MCTVGAWMVNAQVALSEEVHNLQCRVQSKNQSTEYAEVNRTRQKVVGVQRGEKPLVRNACHSKTRGSHVITIHLHVCNSILPGIDFSTRQL